MLESLALLSSLPHRDDRRPEAAVLLTSLGQLWAAGVPIDWDAFQAGEERQRVPLPGYPFARERHWMDAPSTATAPRERARITLERKPDLEDWFYRPVWQPAEELPAPSPPERSIRKGCSSNLAQATWGSDWPRLAGTLACASSAWSIRGRRPRICACCGPTVQPSLELHVSVRSHTARNSDYPLPRTYRQPGCSARSWVSENP